MEQIETGSFLESGDAAVDRNSVRVVSWNINRGLQLDGVIDFLRQTSADLVLLQEADVNARRTQHRHIAREIAKALRMAYSFGCEFQELAQGSSLSPAYHGQATLSRLPIVRSRILRFGRQSGFWKPRWYVPTIQKFQRRLGARIALISHIDWFTTPLLVYNLHLESRGNDGLRYSQLSEVLDDVQQHGTGSSIVVAGDFNFDLSKRPAASLFSNGPVRGNGLLSPFATVLGGATTTVRGKRNGAGAIDWILVGGPLQCAEPEAHRQVTASDHYPLSLVITHGSRVDDMDPGRLAVNAS